MIYIACLSITILFFVFALVITPILKRLTGFKLCAICAACSSTWITLLILRQLDLADVDDTLIGVLMGGSVVGIMKELEEYFKGNKLKHFWIVRILEIVVGFYVAYAVTIWNVNMILIGAVTAVFVIIITLMLTDILKKKDDKGKKTKTSDIPEDEKQEAIKKLEKSLEDCC